MKTEVKGWVIVNHNHPNNPDPLMMSMCFGYTRAAAIEKFIEGSGETWNYWRKKYNFRAVRAIQSITTIQ